MQVVVEVVRGPLLYIGPFGRLLIGYGLLKVEVVNLLGFVRHSLAGLIVLIMGLLSL